MDLINISNLPTSKAYFDALISKVSLDHYSQDELQEYLSGVFFQQKGHIRKTVNHLVLIGCLQSEGRQLSLTKIAKHYLQQKISFEDLIIELLKFNHVIQEMTEVFLNVCAIYDEPISKSILDKIFTDYFLERKDKSAFSSISRNTRSLVNLLDWAGFIHKNAQGVLLPETAHSLLRDRGFKILSNRASLRGQIKTQSKGDIFIVVKAASNEIGRDKAFKLFTSIAKYDELYNWSVTSYAEDGILIKNNLNRGVRFFVRKDDV